MKWYGITGSWRKTNEDIERDVRTAVRNIIEHGDGIVTGGSLNVDWFATDEAMLLNPTATQIKVCIPSTLEEYSKHYSTRVEEGDVTPKQAREIIEQLMRLKSANPDALIENLTNTTIDKKTYQERNALVVELSDSLLGFQVNGSTGVQDTLDKARDMGKGAELMEYTID